MTFVTHHLLNGVRDEYEGDEAREPLLREAGHVLDDVTGVREYQQETLETRVDADPQTQLHVVYTITPVRTQESHDCVASYTHSACGCFVRVRLTC